MNTNPTDSANMADAIWRDAELEMLQAETDKLFAERGKLFAAIRKALAESRKLDKEISWYPFVAGAAFATALHGLFRLLA